MDDTPQWEWAHEWATEARATGAAKVANLLADLAADAPRAYTAHLLSLPIATAAIALGMSPAVLLATLGRLSEARLITHTVSHADTCRASVEIILHPARSRAAAFAECPRGIAPSEPSAPPALSAQPVLAAVNT
ncbi:hypothetical protein AB0C76_34010 [Kitasatospora sp. NPDC048722]|uniref:hypothetical protein n=1 Tax=Kitasatospora sp. NPDC048722 TaxID=3155639 RepID=UPI0033E3C6CB